MQNKSDSALLEKTRVFWNCNPCDGQADPELRMSFRYGKEPWLPPILDQVAQHSSILEMGCGQGVDATYCCQRMQQDGSYIGIDYSENSVQNAKETILTFESSLSVIPKLEIGNVESLSFENSHFDCILSVGVLHHTPDTAEAIREAARVLKHGGEAYITLYRIYSPKVLGAQLLRFLAHLFDLITFKQGRALGLVRKINPESLWGTMLLECFGVPILKSYTRGQLRRLFKPFSEISIRGVGVGFKLFRLGALIDKMEQNPLGTMWLIKAKK